MRQQAIGLPIVPVPTKPSCMPRPSCGTVPPSLCTALYSMCTIDKAHAHDLSSSSLAVSRVIQFLGPTSVSLFPPPETGEGEGGGEGWWRAHAVLLPPHPNLPPPGGKGSQARGGEGKIEN